VRCFKYLHQGIISQIKRKSFWEITTNPETMPENSTSFVMTNIQATRSKMKKQIGNLYGLRTWVEYGFRQCKQELGWTDYRFTNFSEINKWWEIIFSAYWMISSQDKKLKIYCQIEIKFYCLLFILFPYP
jgi:SRSO17 transposase